MARLQKNIGVRKYSASVALSDESLGQVNMRFLSSIGVWVSDLFILSSVFPLPSFPSGGKLNDRSCKQISVSELVVNKFRLDAKRVPYLKSEK